MKGFEFFSLFDFFLCFAVKNHLMDVLGACIVDSDGFKDLVSSSLQSLHV
jgi:hypothetical protein